MAPPFKEPEVSPEMMAKLTAIGCTMNEIAAVSGLSVDTLERRYAEVIKNGRNVGKAALRHEQYRMAMTGNPTMLIWLGKQLLGQKDKQEMEIKDANMDFGSLPISGECSTELVKLN